MSDLFIDSGWKYDGTTQNDGGFSLGSVSLSTSDGTLHLKSDFNENVDFKFDAAGAGIGVSLSPIDISVATKEMPSVGVVYANPAFRESLSLDDFTGACLIYSGTGITLAGGGSGALMFFDLGKSLVAGWMAFVASGGLATPVIVPSILGSCSAMVACAGEAKGTPQAGVSGLLGYVRLKKGRRGSEDLCSRPWKVTTNGKDYTYIFHEDGRCYWYEYNNIQISPNGKGKWRLVKNPNRFIEISWESGDTDSWNLPVSLTAQTGTWQTKEKKGSSLTAKVDFTKLTLIHKTLNL